MTLMKKVIIIIFIVVLFIFLIIFYFAKNMTKEEFESSIKVREPAVAGAFYPANKEELSVMIDEFFKKADAPKLAGEVRALIVPHAGYIYSGQAAAYGYKALLEKKINTVIVIGMSHLEYFDGISVYNGDYFKTPLGEVKIDKKLAQKIISANKKINFRKSAHEEEHSLEVQVPFLQKALTTGWEIIPIIMGNDSEETVDILIGTLKDVINDNTLVIASSDLSHYPSYKDAQFSDEKVINAILTGQRENLRKTINDLENKNIPNLHTCACGRGAIEVVMGLMHDKEIKLLKYYNSGDISGDKTRVVGYASIAFIQKTAEANELSVEDKKKLLGIAREAVKIYLKEGKIIKPKEQSEILNQPAGAFITLKKDGHLRGCIGIFESELSLQEVVVEMAIAAATDDPRFTPVSIDELEKLEYEISVLSPLKKVASWREVEIGKQGVKIVRGSRSGVFLPQVAEENNWDLKTFLSVLCEEKAGLPSLCWQDPETEIYVFTAEVFGD